MKFVNNSAIFAWFGINIPFPERVRLIRDAGFDATALWWEEDHPAGRAWRDRAVECVREGGLDIDHLHAPYRRCNQLWSANADERAASVEEHAGWVKDCARHGVPFLVMHPTLGADPPAVSLTGLGSFRRIADAAEEFGVVVALENMRANAHLEAVLSAIDSKHLGLCFDVSHDRLWNEKPLQLVEQWGHRVVTTHICDTDGRRDRHWLPGDGVADIRGAIDMLVERGYAGATVLEVVPARRDCAPAEFLAEARRRLVSMIENGPVAAQSAVV